MLELRLKPPPSLRERNVAARQQRILDSARELIRAEGLRGLSMRKLADQSGLAVKTLYNLWGGRDAILRALVDQAMDGMDRALESKPPIADPLERCRAVITVTIRHLVEDPAISRSMVLARYEAQTVGPLNPALLESHASHILAVAIRKAIDQGLLLDRLDAEMLGRQIDHGLETARVQWAFGILDEEGLRARALYGLYVTLLGVASEEIRPGIEDELRTLARVLQEQDSRAAARTAKLETSTD